MAPTTASESRAEAKRELLNTWLAFKEGRADSIAEKVATLGARIFGQAAWTRQVDLLLVIVGGTGDAQEQRREEGKAALIDTMHAFTSADDDTNEGLVHDLGEEIYEEEWAIAVKKRIDQKLG